MSEQDREDIAAASALMGSSIGAGKELKDLESELRDGERVLALVAGRHGAGNGLLALTGTRLFFLHEGLARKDFVDIPLADVSAVEWKTGLNLGSLTIFAGGEIDIAGIDKDGGAVFVDRLNAVKPQAG
ncbi:PH domain-containing protein [Actinoplanes sp. NPDC051494]|uniref:PH domain-containing protein n=1 Tax=Actinoplanes sp. NPDC051494 TaxID=3363907 RepID=UPI003796BD46